jgi:hypothetical protein
VAKYRVKQLRTQYSDISGELERHSLSCCCLICDYYLNTGEWDRNNTAKVLPGLLFWECMDGEERKAYQDRREEYLNEQVAKRKQSTVRAATYPARP